MINIFFLDTFPTWQGPEKSCFSDAFTIRLQCYFLASNPSDWVICKRRQHLTGQLKPRTVVPCWKSSFRKTRKKIESQTNSSRDAGLQIKIYHFSSYVVLWNIFFLPIVGRCPFACMLAIPIIDVKIHWIFANIFNNYFT